jgi:hypothetical protein
LLSTEHYETEVPPSLGDVEQHFPDISIGPVPRRVLVQLVDEYDEVFDAKVSALEMFAELGNDSSEDEVLRIFLEVGDVDYIHRPVDKAPERKVADVA